MKFERNVLAIGRDIVDFMIDRPAQVPVFEGKCENFTAMRKIRVIIYLTHNL